MNDWSDYALGRLKKQAEDQRLKDQKFLEKQRLKKAHGTPLWHEVRRIAKENAEHLNAKAGREILVFEVTQNTTLKVRANLESGPRTLQALFDGETGKVEWECEGKAGAAWNVLIEDDGTPRFYWSLVPTTPASMVKQMLDKLLFD